METPAIKGAVLIAHAATGYGREASEALAAAGHREFMLKHWHFRRSLAAYQAQLAVLGARNPPSQSGPAPDPPTAPISNSAMPMPA